MGASWRLAISTTQLSFLCESPAWPGSLTEISAGYIRRRGFGTSFGGRREESSSRSSSSIVAPAAANVVPANRDREWGPVCSIRGAARCYGAHHQQEASLEVRSYLPVRVYGGTLSRLAALAPPRAPPLMRRASLLLFLVRGILLALVLLLSGFGCLLGGGIVYLQQRRQARGGERSRSLRARQSQPLISDQPTTSQDPKAAQTALVFIGMGAVLFVPGFYYSRIAYMAWCAQ